MLIEKVRRTIARFGMIPPGARVLVGVSGGADSVALAHVLDALSRRLEASLVLAHLNHGLREEAEDDARFCRELAAGLGRDLVEGRVDVAAEARRSGRSLEHAGREVRYGFFAEQAERLGCERVAVGHTLDDQAETLLLRLLRGAGTRGLAAVHPVVDGRVVRPLIGVRRLEVEAFLSARGLSFREDVTNRDPRFTRNRLRHEALPRLREGFNPRLEETLAGTAAILRDEEDWMESETAALFERVARLEPDGISLEVASLASAHVAARRRLVRRALLSTRGELLDVSRAHVEGVLELLEEGKSGRELHLPGVTAVRSFGGIQLRREPGRGRRTTPENGYNVFEYPLSIPARIRISECGGTLTARYPTKGESKPAAAGASVVVGLRSEPGSGGPLTVRSPRRGDRFRPLGAPGSKPLTRYLMERKVARDERRAVPVVCLKATESGGRDEILWVVGHGVAEAARLESGRPVLALGWERS